MKFLSHWRNCFWPGTNIPFIEPLATALKLHGIKLEKYPKGSCLSQGSFRHKLQNPTSKRHGKRDSLLAFVLENSR